jgi:3-methyladenine DNA glycosylase AlkD
VNNWNLVDASAPFIVGAHLHQKNKEQLLTLAQSQSLWGKRIAIVSTLYFIRNNDLEWTFKIAKLLLDDKHDLIHKAVGWMLREAGKKDQNQLIDFLEQYAGQMPRTMLRYSVERFPEQQRKIYLNKPRIFNEK